MTRRLEGSSERSGMPGQWRCGCFLPQLVASTPHWSFSKRVEVGATGKWFCWVFAIGDN